MKKVYWKKEIEVWGGIECSYNRIADTYMDQLDLSGHYNRRDDIERIAGLGIKMLRYPVLWEKHQPISDASIDWTFAQQQLSDIKEKGVEPIVGLVHHGSGPTFANFFDGSFATGLAAYAAQVAARFPWVEYYTPVNEPLTTARFCGLYGHWFPHKTDSLSFLQILLAECKGTVLAMQAIRQVNPGAKLVQTEDLGKTHSTPLLRYQADFENNRRWLSFDLLCGRVNKKHPLWKFIIKCGITKKELQFFIDNPCPPDIIGINHYITSERFLDQRTKHYPANTIGGNGRHRYADVEAVRLKKDCVAGPATLLLETWNRYQLPIAVTEVHLHCTREEQLRWFYHVWQAAHEAKEKGADIKAITAWAVLGSFDWCSLLTKPCGIYEPGLFDVRSTPVPRPTALTKLVGSLARGESYYHPVLDECGWWQRDCRMLYFPDKKAQPSSPIMKKRNSQPLLIIGKTGTLGKAFSKVCDARGIYHLLLGREDVDILNPTTLEVTIKQHNPWAIVNAAGYVRVDDAEDDADHCFLVNTVAPQNMSSICERLGIQFVTFSSDLVFDGKKNNPYLESDEVGPLSIYGQSKAIAEETISTSNKDALVIRTSAFFGPWDQYNFVYQVLHALIDKQEVKVANDLLISPTYVPDLVNTSLDLLIDEANGIWNISNTGETSWWLLAKEIADRTGHSSELIEPAATAAMGWKARRPPYSVLTTEKGFKLPSLEDALTRFFKEQELVAM